MRDDSKYLRENFTEEQILAMIPGTPESYAVLNKQIAALRAQLAAAEERGNRREKAYCDEHRAHSELLGILSEFLPAGSDVREALLRKLTAAREAGAREAFDWLERQGFIIQSVEYYSNRPGSYYHYEKPMSVAARFLASGTGNAEKKDGGE